jgi:hypothetical protein
MVRYVNVKEWQDLRCIFDDSPSNKYLSIPECLDAQRRWKVLYSQTAQYVISSFVFLSAIAETLWFEGTSWPEVVKTSLPTQRNMESKVLQHFTSLDNSL